MCPPSIVNSPVKENSTNIFVTKAQFNSKTVKCSLGSQLGGIQSRAEDQKGHIAAVDSIKVLLRRQFTDQQKILS